MKKVLVLSTMIAVLSGLSAQAAIVYTNDFSTATLVEKSSNATILGGASPEIAVEEWFSASNGVDINDELQLTNFADGRSRGAGVWLDSSGWGLGTVTVTFDVLDYAAGGLDSESFFQAYYATGVDAGNSVSVDVHGGGGADPAIASTGSATIGTIGARNTITANATQVEFTFNFTGQDNIALVFHNKSAATGAMPVYSVDNLSVNTIPGPAPVTVWELDMNTDPVLTNWVVRKASSTNYTLSGGVMTMNDETLLDTDPVNSLKGVTQVDLEWRSITEGTGNGRGAFLWLNIDGDEPEFYSIRFESILTNDTQTVQFVNGDAVAHEGFSTNMLTLSATVDAFSETANYIVTDGILSVTNSVDLVASAGTANQAATLGTQGPSAEVDYVRVEANARPDEAHLVASDVIAIDLVGPATNATGSVDLDYGTVNNNLEITSITVSDESHGVGSFNVVTVSPVTLDDAAYGTSELEVEFDNGVAGLPYGSATGLVTVTWTETGSGVTTDTVVPVSASVTPTPNQANSFNGDGDGVHWGDADNWNLDRVPGVYAADRGIIANGGTVTVATNFTGGFTYEVTVRKGATLDIAADLKNVDDMNIGTAVDQAATVNQTAGDVTSASLDISVANNSSNAVYILSDGSIDVSGNVTIESNGVLQVTGGTATMASGLGGTANGTDIKAGGLIEVSGGTYVDTSRPLLAAGGTFRIIGDDASVTIHQPTVGFIGTVDFVLDETGVSTLTSDSWGKLHLCNFTIDGSAYTNGGPADIVLFSSTYHATANNELGSNYSVTGLGTEGVDWSITETNDVTLGRSVTLNILGIVEIGDITMGGVNEDGDLVFSWDTAVGQSYNVETNINLVYPNWGVYTTIVGDGNPISFTNTPALDQLFYKVTSD